MIETPVRGMRDILPTDLRLRDYLMKIIERRAVMAGYQKIETPAIEHLENLTSKDGGENETLIFKILKRGRDLEKAKAENGELADSALRYDLTVPLSRYFAAHSEELTMPFKSLQMGSVWRADAPQKGRFRQFVQCDMDVLGDASVMAEIDTINTVLGILTEVCENAKLTGLTVRINDRRILTAAATYAGFSEEEFSSVLIALDKNDKIGLDGVKNELKQQGFDEGAIAKFIALFEGVDAEITAKKFCEKFDGLDEKVLKNLETIMNAVKGCGRIVFDPTLVRGMGYYTGPIFECIVDGLSSSIAGGGRYDHMIGKFSGREVPACGFSIGFERLVTVLDDVGFVPPRMGEACAMLVSQKVPTEKYAEIMKKAEEKRKEGKIVSVLMMARNLGRQIELLEKNGFVEIEKIYQD